MLGTAYGGGGDVRLYLLTPLASQPTSIGFRPKASDSLHCNTRQIT